MAQRRTLELLAPARDTATAREAILHGADAVYIGGPSHGARAAAVNSIDEIRQLCQFAHIYGVRVYVTLNTIIYDNELSDVERLVAELYRIGVDALIVQDMALLEMDIPPIDLHASTQCDIRSVERARYLADCGFSQLVLPREFTLEQIGRVHDAVGDDVVLEAFVHGALCVSYSGDCQASAVIGGRSANRGECAQICRLAYDLVDADGNVLVHDKHLLSLRDLNRLADLDAMAMAGVSSFKIEGRLKDVAYVKTVTAAYRRALDRLIAAYPDRYERSSRGVTRLTFDPDVERVFNRGFTTYFLHGQPPANTPMANINTPKWVGERVGKVVKTDGKAIIAQLDRELHNGDGLGYYDPEGRYRGFRLNRIDGNRLMPAGDVRLPRGTELYRNSDIVYNARMARETATRRIPVSVTLRHTPGSLWIDISTSDGVYICASVAIEVTEAQTPQLERRRRELAKTGDTPFEVADIDDRLGDNVFVAASVLTTLRRHATDLLQRTLLTVHRYRYRRAERAGAIPAVSGTYHDNIANHMAAAHYRRHGVQEIVPAMECTDAAARAELAKSDDGLRVMTTRYCLRRQLGACLKTPDANKLPKQLYLQNDRTRLKLQFDCKNCQMCVVHSE